MVLFKFFIVQSSTLVTLVTALLGSALQLHLYKLRVCLAAPISWVGIIDERIIATKHPVHHIANPKEDDKHSPEMPIVRRIKWVICRKQANQTDNQGREDDVRHGAHGLFQNLSVLI